MFYALQANTMVTSLQRRPVRSVRNLGSLLTSVRSHVPNAHRVSPMWTEILRLPAQFAALASSLLQPLQAVQRARQAPQMPMQMHRRHALHVYLDTTPMSLRLCARRAQGGGTTTTQTLRQRVWHAPLASIVLHRQYHVRHARLVVRTPTRIHQQHV